MTEIKRKSSEKHKKAYIALITLILTVGILAVPMGIAWILVILHCAGCVTVHHPDYMYRGYILAYSSPVIVMFSAIITSWLVVYLLRLRNILWTTLLTLVVAGSVLYATYAASTHLIELAAY
jgi:hypothetical protein